MRAAAWFLGWRWPAAGRQRLLQQPLPPLDCVRDGCAARVPARAMFGWVATACRRLASAPGDVLVSDRATWSVACCVMERVSRGRVRRVQVQPQRRAAVSRHMCVCVLIGCCSKRWLTCRWRTAKRRSSMHCRTPRFPAHALFAVCRRHQPRTLRCTRKTRGDRSPAVCSPSGGAMQGGCAFGKRRCAAEQGCRHRGERRLDPPPAEQAAAAG